MLAQPADLVQQPRVLVLQGADALLQPDHLEQLARERRIRRRELRVGHDQRRELSVFSPHHFMKTV